MRGFQWLGDSFAAGNELRTVGSGERASNAEGGRVDGVGGCQLCLEVAFKIFKILYDPFHSLPFFVAEQLG